MGSSYDVAIIGAGAAGLSAAQELCRRGLRVALVEARDRIGGRVYTLRPPGLAFPVELGAEFIHGMPAHTWELLEEGGLLAYEVPDDHWRFSRSGRGIFNKVRARRMRDFWSRLDRALSGIPLSGDDRSFGDFARSNLFLRLSPRDRELVTSFVEGFNAAPKDRISVQSLAITERLSEAVDISRIFKIVSGYDRLLQHLWNRTNTDACSVLLNCPVREVRWEKGAVRLIPADPEQEAVEARQAIVTLPVGVLAARAVRFAPELPEKSALIEPGKGLIEMGAVTKVILHLNHVLWEELGLSKFGFIHASPEESAFPAWWNAAPMQVPLLTGWAGGPAAAAMAGRPRELVLELAVYSLSRLFSIEPATLRQGIEQFHFHDWQADPYSFGAYSYPAPGGLGALGRLARPVEDTLFFAGEATLANGLSGTVDGAIATGFRAAREAIASLRAVGAAA